MITDEKKKVLRLFAEGREFYKKREFESALNKFKNCLEIDKQDGPSRVYYTRCKAYIDSPPPEDWDGVFDMKTK